MTLIQWEIWFCFSEMLRPVGIMVVNGIRSVFLTLVVSVTFVPIWPWFGTARKQFLHGPAPGRGPVFDDPWPGSWLVEYYVTWSVIIQPWNVVLHNFQKKNNYARVDFHFIAAIAITCQYHWLQRILGLPWSKPALAKYLNLRNKIGANFQAMPFFLK